MKTADQISEDAILQVGKVIAVRGRVVEIKVHKSKNTSHLVYKGELLKNVSVGSYIKIIKGFTRIIGKIDGEYIGEDKLAPRQNYGSSRERISRVLSVSLLGFFNERTFERGIKEMPLLDNECYLLHKHEFEQVHNFIKLGDEPIEIGALSLEKGQTIRVGVTGLFASHIGIFGNTGSGKSYTLAKLYRELFEKYKDSKKFRRTANFLLIDFNGEYVNDKDDVIIEKRYKRIFKLSTRGAGKDRLPLTIEAIRDAEFWVVFLEATEKTQMPFLRRAVGSDFLLSKIEDEAELKALIARMVLAATTEGDRTLEKAVVTNFLTELRAALFGNATLGTLISDLRAHLKFHTQQNVFYYQVPGTTTYSNQAAFKDNIIEPKVAALHIDTAALAAIDKVRLQIVIQYYDDIIRGFSNKEHLAPLIKRMDKRIDDLKKVVEVSVEKRPRRIKNITIVSLKDVSVHIRKILPLMLCKKLYNDHKAANDEGNYLNIIIDEAHNILSENSERESEQWKDYRLESFEEIIKEGRKFGVFLTIASQRPSDISPTIISQLHNYFLHRLINNEDIRAVEKTISFLDKLSFEYLPILPTGSCIFAGLLANVPVVIDIGRIDPRFEPKNKTMTLIDKWT
jgi:uncharacterized protein